MSSVRYVLCGVLLWLSPGCLGAQDYLVTHYGALAQAGYMNTAHVQAAIDAAFRQGGGRVVVPAGEYLCGQVVLKSNVYLHLSPGAVLLGSNQQEDYPNTAMNHLIYAVDAENTGITGLGTINGQGETLFDKSADIWCENGWRPEPWIRFLRCKRVLVADVLLTDSPAHVLVTEDTDDVRITGITIRNDLRSPNTDGIDVKGGKNIFISQCNIYTGDDGICIKASDYSVSNLIVTDCIIASDDAALKFGTGSKYSISHCQFSNIQIYESRYGITLFMTQGGVYENSVFRNIDIATQSRHGIEYPIYIDNQRRSAEYPNGTVRNIAFEDIRIATRGYILIGGQRDAPIERITMKNVAVMLDGIADIPTTVQGKPRGNKHFAYDPQLLDYSRQNAHIVVGQARDLTFDQIRVFHGSTPVHQEDDRALLFTEDVTFRVFRDVERGGYYLRD